MARDRHPEHQEPGITERCDYASHLHHVVGVFGLLADNRFPVPSECPQPRQSAWTTVVKPRAVHQAGSGAPSR